jgi:hypothetical protein
VPLPNASVQTGHCNAECHSTKPHEHGTSPLSPRLRQLTGQMGLAPVNCRKVMTACIQSVAMFGAELWWRGDGAMGTKERATELPTTSLAWSHWGRLSSRDPYRRRRFSNWAAAGLRPDSIARAPMLVVLKHPVTARACLFTSVWAKSGIGGRLKNALALAPEAGQKRRSYSRNRKRWMPKPSRRTRSRRT